MAIGNAKAENDDIELIDDELEPDDDDEDEDESDDTDDEEEDGDDDSDDSDEEEDSDDDDEEDDEDKEEKDSKGKKDKKDAKIVAQKKEMKALKQAVADAQKRISELEGSSADKDINKQVDAAKAKWVADGYDEKDVAEFAEILKENLKLKAEHGNKEWERLAKKYPSAVSKKAEILKLKETIPDADLEDIYLAKFHKLSAKEQKRLTEQETLFNQKKSQGKGKGNVSGSGKKEKPVTLSKSDERAYEIAKKMFPSLTKKAFKELSNEEEELT